MNTTPALPHSPPLKVHANFWLMAGDQSLGGHGRIELLERVRDSGSIRQAALAMGMSYRAAWGAVQTMERRLGQPLVNRATGGKGGGGATLSPAGQRLIKAYRALEAEHARQVGRLNARLVKLLA
ncbi:winged helix-turn-helix domain-containing protein [Polycyclovorans algicola]|uniref:winged helix-turn-helix domain-containing protein n=1 Tax=Polycyclovorans algicola TaxID=616992 RepID=UPI0009FCA41A|nr:LysR family transcriptional regulator [Polycyclovorans algicola]